MTGGQIYAIAIAATLALGGCGDDEQAEAPEQTEEEVAAEDRRLAELDAADAIREGSVIEIAAYLREFPDGEHVDEARAALRRLVPEQLITYRREAARLGSDPLLVLAAVDAFEAYAEEVPAKVGFETVSNRAAPPEGAAPPHSPDAALREAFSGPRLAQYTGDHEAPLGLGAATGFLFTFGNPEFGDEIIGDGPLFRVERTVEPSELMIGAQGGEQYRSLDCHLRVEVHVPAHEGRPARVTHRESTYTPTSFDVSIPQVQGHDSTNASVRHRAVYDSLLTQMAMCYKRGSAQKLAFYRRPQDYAAAVDMPIPVQSRALDAVVTSLEGTIPGVEVGTRCRIQAGWGNRDTPLDCRVGFVCAGQELYGHETTGYVPCPETPTVIVNDEDPNDGDPAMLIDTSEQKLSFRDVESGRFGEVALEARVIAIDQPTPQLPAPADPAEEE